MCFLGFGCRLRVDSPGTQVAAKKDQEWANLKLEAYRHRVIRKDCGCCGVWGLGSLNPKPETLNPEPETLNPKPQGFATQSRRLGCKGNPGEVRSLLQKGFGVQAAVGHLVKVSGAKGFHQGLALKGLGLRVWD